MVDELSNIVHVTKAKTIGKQMVFKLKDIIPRQMVHIAVQATVNGKVMARENIKPYRKDVTAKLVSKHSLILTVEALMPSNIHQNSFFIF